jgi:hypothetical protein
MNSESQPSTPVDFQDPSALATYLQAVEQQINAANGQINLLLAQNRTLQGDMANLEHANGMLHQRINANVQSASIPPAARNTMEPKLERPERFSGKQKDLRNFVASVENIFALQPLRYDSPRAKTGYLGSLFTGDALTWYRTLQETSDACLTDYEVFKQGFIDMFGDPFIRKTAQDQLEKCQQGSGSTATYVSKFRRIAADTGYNEATLTHSFTKNLSHAVREALAINDEDPASLEDLYRYAIKVDNRLYELRRSTPATRALAPQIRRRSTDEFKSLRFPTPSGPIPMEIGATQFQTQHRRGPLSKEEKQRRRDNNLCLYCGEHGHLALQCPKKAPTSGNDRARANSGRVPRA